MFAEIIVFSALEKTLYYQIPSELQRQAQIGKRVVVPLGRRESLGLILQLQKSLPETHGEINLRPIYAVIDQLPVLSHELLRICRWVSEYYFYPLGEVLKAALPSGIQSSPELSFQLTDAGRKALRSNDAPADLLAFGAQQDQKTNSLPVGEVRRSLKGLEERGLVERYFEWRPPRVTAKTIRTIRLIRSPGPEQLGRSSNLQTLIELLQEAGDVPVPMKVLRKQVKNLDYWLKKLNEQSLVVVEGVQEFRESRCAQALPAIRPLKLTTEQNNIVEEIRPHILADSFRPFLIHGVTGSGKTEIYIQLIEEALRRGKGALVLVPEIALSTQLEALFRQRFGTDLAVWHSGLTAGTRYDQWREVLNGNRKVVLGVRSAIFMPIRELGLIVVDEEHDTSYKQEDRLRYHARDVALMRARLLKIPIILGSATPSLQSFHHSIKSRYKGLSLTRRVLDRPLPELQIVDMRRERGRSRILSVPLQKALRETIQKGEQALVFLNRRGFATFLLCHLCGHVLQCSHCSVSLTYHQKEDRLRCHYCGWNRPIPQQCPSCKNTSLLQHGFGTERVEEEIKQLLPLARTVRIDRDSIASPEDLVKRLNAFRDSEANVLIGTQMVAKGHDFPNITLVGIVNADTALQIADFRAGETTVQLLMQVAGRTGRGDKPGSVILQTYNPGHYTISSVMKMDYELFCRKELASRKELQYPPFARMVKLMVTAPKEEMAKEAAHHLASLCRAVASEFRSQDRPVAILGPTAAPLLRLKRRYRWQLFAKAWTNRALQDFTATILAESKTIKDLRRVQLSIDRDPVTTL